MRKKKIGLTSGEIQEQIKEYLKTDPGKIPDVLRSNSAIVDGLYLRVETYCYTKNRKTPSVQNLLRIFREIIASLKNTCEDSIL